MVPAFNEADRLRSSLPELIGCAREHHAEILLVDDGSTDDTARLADGALRSAGVGRALRLGLNRGKGAAIRAGVQAASGDAVVFMDADLATALSDLPVLLHGLGSNDVVIGSRRSAGSVATDALERRCLGVGFNALVRAMTGLRVTDTQCGFKAFRALAARQLFGLARTDGFAFDVELLLLADRLGMRIAEVPVHWHAVDGSTVNRFRDPARMAADVWRMTHRWTPDLIAAAIEGTQADLAAASTQHRTCPTPALAFT